MVAILGFIEGAANLGVQSLLIKPKRTIGPFIAQATIEEVHTDDLEITNHPVERGAYISDHAFKIPPEVSITAAWSNSPSRPGLFGAIASVLSTFNIPQSLMTGNAPSQVKQLYDAILALQAQRVLIDVVTAKRTYTNMLIKSVRTTTDISNENSLTVNFVLRHVIIAVTTVVSVSAPADQLADAAKTAPITNNGFSLLQSATTFLPDTSSITGAMGNLVGGLGDVSTMFNQLPGGLGSLSGAVSGVVDQIPGAITAAQDAVTSALSKLPLPFEVPTISLPQSFSISLSGATQSVVESAISGLPDILTKTQATIAQTLKQLPNVVDQLPSALSNLPSSLLSVSGQITSTLGKVNDTIHKIPLLPK